MADDAALAKVLAGSEYVPPRLLKARQTPPDDAEFAKRLAGFKDDWNTAPTWKRALMAIPALPFAMGEGAVKSVGSGLAWGARAAGGVNAAGERLDLSNVENTPEADTDAGVGLAMTLALGGAGTAPLRESGLGIFGGKMAKTADHAALAKAEKMAAEGASRDAIWNETGWFAGADGKWRFEIPDNVSAITPKAEDELLGNSYGATQRTAPGVLQHDDLYAAYPELKMVDVDARVNQEFSGYRGSYTVPENNGGRGLIKSESDLMSGPSGTHGVLLHELQHPVQRKEGFATGGSPEEFRGLTKNNLMERGAELEGALARAKANGGQDPVSGDADFVIEMELAKVTKLYKAGGVDPFDQYTRLAGEAEARNVQARMNMTPEQRRATPPWATEDVPTDKQIVRGNRE